MSHQIAILGAGPSGLTLARLLHRSNIPYVVFERESSADSVGQGGTLDIHTETGQVALRECGLYEDFQRLARYDGQAFKALNKAGEILADHQPSVDDVGRPEIDRKQLRELLLHSVPAETIRWGKKVEAVERCPDGTMSVRFADESVEAGFILVVGADGAWSKARKLITPATPTYSGICYLQTCISPSNAFHASATSQIGRGTCFAASDGKAIIGQRMNDGSYNIYAGVRLPEGWAHTHADDLLQSSRVKDYLLRERYADWSATITDLLRHSDDDTPFYCWSLYTLQPEDLRWQSVPGVTLVGDAAHLAMPNGEGVNCGMFDSLQLGRKIISAGSEGLAAAVASYEEEMLPRGMAHIEDGQAMSAMFMAEDSPRVLKDWLASVGM